MKRRKLGKTGLEVSEISLGCWTLGGLSWVNGRPNGWADPDRKEITEAVRYAVERGVSHFDNADVYGNGKAERLLAEALGGERKRVVIATKVGWFSGTAAHAYEPLHIIRQCEQSLVNLQRDWIDLYYFHHADFGENDRYLDGALEAVSRLKKEGKIRHTGLSAYTSGDFLRLFPLIRPDALQGRANITDDKFVRENMPVPGLIRESQASFVAHGPLAQGLLLGKYSSKNPPVFRDGDHRKADRSFSPESIARLEPKLEKLKERFGSERADLSRVALQYVLSHDAVSCVIPGFRNKEQVEELLAGADKPLSRDDVKFIRSVFNQ